jgi:tetratricopeptide (TPR) repeat protein
VLAAGLLPGASPHGAAEALADEALRAPDDPLLQFLAGATLDEAGLYAAPARLALTAAWMDGYLPAAYTLAYHHLRGGETREAARLFGEVRTEEPYAALGAYGLAQARVAAGAYREAGPLLGEVLHHDARFAPALYLLGLVRLAEGRTDEAEALRVRLAVAPSWAAALDFAVGHPAFRPEGVRPLPRGTLAATERLRIVHRDSVNASD